MTNIANWKITMLLMGKSTISMAIFNSYLDITRGYNLLQSYVFFVGLRSSPITDRPGCVIFFASTNSWYFMVIVIVIAVIVKIINYNNSKC